MALRVKLSEDDLKQANGGAVVDIKDEEGIYAIVDDENGYVWDYHGFETLAKKHARDIRVSDEVISKEEYKKRFGKDFVMDYSRIW